MTMIERAARAMAEAEQEQWDLPAAEWDRQALEAHGLMTLARAALQAIREPDAEALGYVFTDAGSSEAIMLAGDFTAIIDAILAEGDKTP